MAISDQEWDQRILCSDGNCIGIIGSDGCCKECGRPYEGELPIRAEDEPAADGDEVAEVVEPEKVDEEDPAVTDFDADSDAAEDVWEDRTLCVDGNCIGVVGPDGRCKVCGKAYPGSPS